MHLLLVGISHKTAPVELRERLDFQVRGVDRALQSLAARGSTREAVVLSTCNRAEVYVACDDVAATRLDLVSFVSEFHAIDLPMVAPHVPPGQSRVAVHGNPSSLQTPHQQRFPTALLAVHAYLNTPHC